MVFSASILTIFRMFGFRKFGNGLRYDGIDRFLDPRAGTPPQQVVDGFRGEIEPAFERGNRREPLADSGFYILRMHFGKFHMIDPKGRNDKSDIPKNRKRQPLSTQDPVGSRLIGLLESRDFGWLSRETGIPVSTLSDYVQRGISKTANAVKIASALGVTVDHLVTGVGAAGEVVVAVAAAGTAEWEQVPLFDLQSSATAGKGRPLPPVPLRKDWLNRAIGETEGIWLTNLPSDYAAADLREGDVIFCKDARLPDLVAHAL